MLRAWGARLAKSRCKEECKVERQWSHHRRKGLELETRERQALLQAHQRPTCLFRTRTAPFAQERAVAPTLRPPYSTNTTTRSSSCAKVRHSFNILL